MQRRTLPRAMGRYTTSEHALVPPPEPVAAAAPEPRQAGGMSEPRRARPMSPTRRLAAIAERHREGAVGYCPVCLLPWPCATYTLATGEPEPASRTEGTEGGSVT